MQRTSAMKITLFLLFFLTFSSLQADDFDIGNRSIGEIPEQCDERINGYREDYRKIDRELIQLPSKYRKKGKKGQKKDEKKPEPALEIPKDEKSPAPASPESTDTPAKQAQGTAKKTPESSEQKPAPGYYGETFNGVRDGRGKLVLANGDIYDGHWSEGKKEGHGIYIYASGIKYNGTWHSDKMDGYGSLIFPDGSSYNGEFSDGEISGTGTFYYTDKARYTGEWSKGKWHGEGRFKLANGRELHAIFAEQQIVQIISEIPEGPDTSEPGQTTAPEKTGQKTESVQDQQ